MAYIGNSPENIQRGKRFIYEFKATAGQTVFSGTDLNNQTLDLLEENEMGVYLNGVRLADSDDYTVSGDTLTLVSAASLNDQLTVETQAEIANISSYTRAEADARYINYDGDIVAGDLQISGEVDAGSLIVDTDVLVVDAANNRVGVGTTSPDKIFVVQGSSAEVVINDTSTSRPVVRFRQNGSTKGLISTDSSEMKFYTDGALVANLRMTIDASGNVLVGKTSSSFANDGGEIKSNGQITATASNAAAMQMNRRSSDGTILNFAKNGSTVGSIGTFSDDLYIHTGDTGLRFNDGNDQIWPVSSGGSSRDNAISLGGGTIRFKDLYLSGKITNDGSGGISIDADGNVGIGTTSPSYTLDVDVGAPSSTDKTIARFSSQVGIRDIGFVWDDSQSTMGIATLTNHKMVFHTNGNSNPRMAIDTSGRVGIGTTNPAARFEVEGSQFHNWAGRFENTNGNGYGLLAITAGTDAADKVFELRTGTSSTVMLVDGTGKVGIGTTSPNAKLDVRGQGLFHGSTGSYVGTNVGAITINSNEADNTYAFSQGLVFTNNTSNAGPWTHAGITTEGSTGYRGDLVFGTDGDGTNNTTGITEKMRIMHNGNIIAGNNGVHSWTADNNTLFASGGIGVTANSDWCLQLAGSSSNRIRFFTSSGGSTQVGTITVSTSGTTYNTTSDRRLKDNITTITDGKEKLLAMNPVTHTWKADPDAPAVHGFVAQEMQEVIPEAVSGDAESDNMMSMDYGRITPVIVAAMQDALKEIEELKTRIQDLENQ